jgi:alkylation response protein AidB-like acyl-CoA dehydrogenase
MAATDELAHIDALIDELLAECPLPATPMPEFLGAQFDRGLAWVHFPTGHGGLGLSPKHQTHINSRLFAAGAANPFFLNPMGYGMCGPTVVEWGSDDQRSRYLRPLFTANEMWCQLFSEPGAEWILNGQKVWTSLAHIAKWGLVIVRTDPTAVKHSGITAFVVDMHAPGVEVRPLRQMTGGAEFNEVYFTDVRVPAAEMLGSPGEGWRVSLTTLMNERTAIGGSTPPRGAGPIAHAVELFNELDDAQQPFYRNRLMELWCEAEAIRLNNLRAAANRRMGSPGPEGSIGKMAGAEHNKRVYEFCMDLLGPQALLYDDYASGGEGSGLASISRVAFLRSRANTIEGGTAEIMRNILGERVLGLPGDVRVDRDRPWKEVPRS